MPNLPSTLQPSRLAQTMNPSPSLVSKYTKVNADRLTRQDARERRRRGDWGILEIPTALLWLDEVCATAALEGDMECPAPLVDLWP